jgi:hypothetical protein
LKTAVAPDSTVWRVRRRWLPRHESFVHRWIDRRRRSDGDGSRWWPLDVLELEATFWLLLIGLVVGTLVFFGIPLVLAVVDAVLLLILVVGGVVARVLLRRPWTVEAESGDRVITRQVVGWKRSGEEVEVLVRQATHGQLG